MSREENEKTGVEPAVKQYMEKWGVSEEEAKKQIQKFLAKRPVDRSKATPAIDNLFPEPVGPLSEKIQDVNQAALSTAFTRKSLKEMNQPPEELQDLRKRVDDTMETVNNMLELVTTTMKDMQSTLEGKQKAEERQQLIKDIEERVIQPLKQDLEAVKKEVEVKPPKTEENLRTMREKIKGFEEEARGTLEELGIQVPERRVVTEGPAVPRKDEELVDDLKRRGYRVEFDMVSREEAQRLAEDAKRRVQEDLLEDKRIQAVENIIRDMIKNIFEMFSPPLRKWMEGSLESREAEAEGGGAESEPRKQSAS